MSAEIERRFLSAKAAGEVRSDLNAAGAGISGTAAVCDSLSEDLGGFREQVKIGAFDKALKTSDVLGLFNHSVNHVLARVKSGTMKVWADREGLHFDIPVLPKSRFDVYEAVQRRDVTGCSYSFKVAANGDSWATSADGSRIRTIHEIAAVYDVGPVCQPAFTETQVSVRALALATETARVRPPRDSAVETERARLDAASQKAAADLASLDREEEDQALEQLRSRNIKIFMHFVDDDAAMRNVERIAVHEAGHCVSYWLDGAGVDAVGLIFEENPTACVGGYARCQDVELKSAQSILAGIAANRIGGQDLTAVQTYKEIEKARKELPPGRRSHDDIEREIGRASDTLRKYWPAVTALASEIRQKTDLRGAEAETIIARALIACRGMSCVA